MGNHHTNTISYAKVNTPRRHHYLPRFYLENFAGPDGLLWVFDRETKQYRQQSPKDTAVQGEYYTFLDKAGNKNRDIENFFSVIEGRTRPITQKVDAGEKLTEDDRIVLATFISFLKTRVPDFEKTFDEMGEKGIKRLTQLTFSSKESAEASIKRYENVTGKKVNISPEELIDFVQGDRYGIKFPRESSIEAMLNVGATLTGYFIDMDWVFLLPPSKVSFITSDNPFVLLPPRNYNPNSVYGFGIATSGTEKVIPLSSKSCLVIGDIGEEGVRVTAGIVSKDAVRDINYRVAINSDRFLIAGDRALLEDVVVKTKVDQWKKEQRVLVS